MFKNTTHLRYVEKSLALTKKSQTCMPSYLVWRSALFKLEPPGYIIIIMLISTEALSTSYKNKMLKITCFFSCFVTLRCCKYQANECKMPTFMSGQLS